MKKSQKSLRLPHIFQLAIFHSYSFFSGKRVSERSANIHTIFTHGLNLQFMLLSSLTYIQTEYAHKRLSDLLDFAYYLSWMQKKNNKNSFMKMLLFYLILSLNQRVINAIGSTYI